jgi:AcrR family transcriptional regulator
MAESLEIERSRKPRGEGPSRRGEILAAAKLLFLEEGFERATMRRIAAAVGVSSTALYVYFPDKEAILRAIAEQTFADLLAELEAVDRLDAPPLERLRAGLRAYIAFGRARPDEYRLMFLAKMMMKPAPGNVCQTIEAADRSFDIMERAIAALMLDGVFRPGSSSTVAEALWATVHGTTALLLDHSDHLSSDPEQFIETVLDVVLRGLIARH